MTAEPMPSGVESEAFLDRYPGPALVVDGEGRLVRANSKGVNLRTLMDHGAAPELSDLIVRARKHGSVMVGSVALQGSRGDIVLEITVTPHCGGGILVLARDLTMERNLRSALVESRQRYKDLVEVSSDFAWEVGQERTFAFVSPRGALGFRAEQLVGRLPDEFVLNPDEYSPLPFLSKHALEDVEMWMRRADGELACVMTSCLPLFTEDGHWRGARGICRDVTMDREREAALTRARNREQLLNYVVRTIRDELEPLDMLNTAAAATARALGAAGCRIYREMNQERLRVAATYGAAEEVGDLDAFLHRFDDHTPVLEEVLGHWRVLAAPTRYRLAINGAICMWRDLDDGEWDDDNRILIGDVANQLGIANEQIANHERIVNLSRTDGLTGLLNRRAFFEEELPRRIKRLHHDRETAGLLYVDMDNFKRVNDVHGHQAGDEAILALRDLLEEHSRPGDVIARLGGDEFAIWLDGLPEEIAERRARELIEASRVLRSYSGDEDHPLGISIGVAVYRPSTGESLEDLIARADMAMYQVKHHSKGSYAMAPPPGGVAGDDWAGEEERA